MLNIIHEYLINVYYENSECVLSLCAEASEEYEDEACYWNAILYDFLVDECGIIPSKVDEIVIYRKNFSPKGTSISLKQVISFWLEDYDAVAAAKRTLKVIK